MGNKLKYLVVWFLLTCSVFAYGDSLVKKNNIVIGVYGGISRPPRSGEYLLIGDIVKKDKSYISPLVGFCLQYERKLKHTHFIMFGLSYFYGQYAVSSSASYIDSNITINNGYLKTNFTYYNFECSYRKRWHLGKQNKYNLILDAGIYSVLYVNQALNYNFTTYINGVITQTLSYSQTNSYSEFNKFNNNALVINGWPNFSIVNRLGFEKKFKKTSISFLISNYIPVSYIYTNFSPYSFNPLLTFQLHV